MKNVVILFGGMSNEYNVSLKSASSVIEAMNKEKYCVYPVGITEQGNWFLYTGDVENIKTNQWIQDTSHLQTAIICPNRSMKGILLMDGDRCDLLKVDLIFPVMHGKFAEDGTIQGLIELSGIKMVGCKTLSSALCMDKSRAHKLVDESGIDVAKSIVINEKTTKAEIIQAGYSITYPLFVKPVRSGSSIGISFVKNENNLFEAVDLAFKHDKEVVIEERIKGFEVGCSILEGDELIIGEVDEIEIQTDFFDYEEKYNTQTTKNYLPARISSTLRNQVKEAAVQIYKVLNCEGFARIDMFIDENNKIVFNEVNTIPGFTNTSRFPSMLKAVGYSFEQVIEILLEKAA